MLFLVEHLTEVILGVISITAMMLSLLQSRVKTNTATAAAVNELATASKDLRQRITTLEEENTYKDERIRDLREQAAQIPILKAQVQYLTQELTQVKMEYHDKERRLIAEIRAKDAEIDRLRRLVGEPQPE